MPFIFVKTADDVPGNIAFPGTFVVCGLKKPFFPAMSLLTFTFG